MKKPLWERAIESKYAILLGSLVSLICTSPLLALNEFLGFVVQSFLFAMVILGMLRILKAGRALFLVCGVLVALAIFFHYRAFAVAHVGILACVAGLSYVFVVGIVLLLLLKRVFSEKSVTQDTVKGGISIYILIGLWWETLYATMWMFDKGSFIQDAHRTGIPDFFYFSFTTLTTLGYGDVLPASEVAKIASTLEAMVGQIYLAVFIARLVGLHVAHASRSHHPEGE